MRLLRTLVDHPYTHGTIALILIATSLAEAWETLREDIVHVDPQGHHGVLVFGVFALLRAIADVLERAARA